MAKQNHTLSLSNTQLNTNPDLSSLSDEVLCQIFVNLHCTGQKDAAKPFLKAFVARHQESATPGDNRPFFAALVHLAKRGEQ